MHVSCGMDVLIMIRMPDSAENCRCRCVKVIGTEKVALEILPGYEHADDRMFEEANVRKVFDFLDRINGRTE